MLRSALAAALAFIFFMAAWGAAQATPYVETFDTTPQPTPYAALIRSPNGLKWDWWQGRAFQRLDGSALPPGDETFYWLSNSIAPEFAGYSGDTTPGYLVNGYGTGYPGYPLGFDFTGPTQV